MLSLEYFILNPFSVCKFRMILSIQYSLEEVQLTKGKLTHSLICNIILQEESNKILTP